MTSRDAIDDLLPKLPEVGSASVTTSEERLDNVRQEESTEDHGLVDESCTETLNVELSAVTSLVNEDVELLLPSVAEMTVPRIEEDVSEQFHLQAEDIWQPETSVQRIEEDVSEQFHLQAEDIWQPETSVQIGDLHDIAIKVEKQQQQQQTQQQQQLQEQQEQQQQQQQQQLEQHIEKPTEEIAPTLEVSESVEVVPKPLVMSTVTELPAMPVYPRLDSLIAGKYYNAVCVLLVVSVLLSLSLHHFVSVGVYTKQVTFIINCSGLQYLVIRHYSQVYIWCLCYYTESR